MHGSDIEIKIDTEYPGHDGGYELVYNIFRLETRDEQKERQQKEKEAMERAQAQLDREIKKQKEKLRALEAQKLARSLSSKK